jgi:hypothetical protein
MIAHVFRNGAGHGPIKQRVAKHMKGGRTKVATKEELMDETTRLCLKCQGMMEEGFVIDRGGHNMLNASTWFEGPPEPSLWFGPKTAAENTSPYNHIGPRNALTRSRMGI